MTKSSAESSGFVKENVILYKLIECVVNLVKCYYGGKSLSNRPIIHAVSLAIVDLVWIQAIMMSPCTMVPYYFTYCF